MPHTDVRINGERQRLLPTDPLAHGMVNESLGSFSTHLFSRAVSQPNGTSSSWVRAAMQAVPSIIILGSSITAGCNSGVGRECIAAKGWARLMVDFIRWQVRHKAQPVALDVSIWFKNAVPPSFFAKCVAARVPPGPGVVLLEVCTNAWGGAKPLETLVSALRRVAPEKAVAFICWQSRSRSVAQVQIDAVREAAARGGADVLDVGAALVKPREEYYADQVHPNIAGHGVMAVVAARFIARRLMQAGAIACGSPLAARAAIASAPSSTAPPWYEQCYTSADEIPVASPSSWTLVDEGGAKGIHKMGWASDDPGETLTVGPLPHAPNITTDACSHDRVELGYLVSATRPHRGAFNISCTGGCECAAITTPYPRLHPFPRVQTDPHVGSIESGTILAMNASLTVTTSFDVLRYAVGTECFVQVTHLHPTAAPVGASPREPPGANASHSHVRIDSLTISSGAITPSFLGYAWVRGQQTHGKRLARSAAPCLRLSPRIESLCRLARSQQADKTW